MKKLATSTILDKYIRENFAKIEEEVRNQAFLNGKFKFFTIEFSAATSHLRYPHSLGFLPKDTIQTSLIGAGALTWHYDLFDEEFLDISTTGACTVRAFIGTYQEGSPA